MGAGGGVSAGARDRGRGCREREGQGWQYGTGRGRDGEGACGVAWRSGIYFFNVIKMMRARKGEATHSCPVTGALSTVSKEGEGVVGARGLWGRGTFTCAWPGDWLRGEWRDSMTLSFCCDADAELKLLWQEHPRLDEGVSMAQGSRTYFSYLKDTHQYCLLLTLLFS